MAESVDLNLYTKEVEVANIRPGDILAHDIYLRNGLLVAKAGIELNENQIKKLKNMGRMVVTLDLSKAYKKTVAASKVLMNKAAKGLEIIKDEVLEMINPFITEANREKNAIRLLLDLESQDEYTFQHTVNIGIISLFIGKWVGLNNRELEELALAGTLHDIGKSKIPLTILNKPTGLTPIEFETMKKHTVWGYEILKKSDNYSENVMLGVLQHHERVDGKGYCLGLKKSEINSYAKIIAIADTYHAMTTDRVYKPKVSPFKALENLQKDIFSLDTELVMIFVNRMLDFLIGNTVLLSNGKKAKVIYIDKNYIGSPVVQLEEDLSIQDMKIKNYIKIERILYT